VSAILRAREKRAVFDLEHLLALSDAPSLPLVVSERTLYLLENLSLTDITDASRFSSTPVEDNLYMAVDEEDVDEYALFLDVMHQAQLEILETMATDFSFGLMQDIPVSHNIIWARYAVIGNWVFVNAKTTISTAGVSGQPLYIWNWPEELEPADNGDSVLMGVGSFYGGVSLYNLEIFSVYGQDLKVFGVDQGLLLGSNPALAVKSGDVIRLNLAYEI